MTEFLYFARLAPLDETLIVRGKHGRTIEYFDSSIFALEREQPDRVAVLLDHDERRNVGHLDTLFNRNGWLIGTFRLNQRSSWSGVAEDRLELGTPVSPAWEPNAMGDFLGDGIKRMVCGQLFEVSIVDGGAIRGAQITSIHPLPKRQAPRSSSTAKPQPVEAIHRGQPISDTAWRQEMERRMDWLEANTGRPADMEAVVRGLRRETEGPTLEELYAETIGRRPVA